MRTPALLLVGLSTLALAVAASPARADDGDDGDDDGPAFVPLPKWNVAVGFQGHGTRIAGVSESGYGAAFEIAYGRGRWQYLVEGSIASAGMSSWTTPATETRVDGRLMRGTLGLRWLARQFAPTSGGGFELLLLSALGMQRFTFEDSDIPRVRRPEIAVGFAFQVRGYRRPRVAFRIDTRVLFTPDDEMRAAGSSTGFLTGMALAW